MGPITFLKIRDFLYTRFMTLTLITCEKILRNTVFFHVLSIQFKVCPYTCFICHKLCQRISWFCYSYVTNLLWACATRLFLEGLPKYYHPSYDPGRCGKMDKYMATSSNGHIFGVTGHLCEEFTGHQWNSPHKGQWRGALVLSLICTWINGWVNNREAGDFRRHRSHYEVTVIT